MLSLAESVDHNPGWDPTDDTDADGFAMIVTVFLKLEFNQEFYNIESPKYPRLSGPCTRLPAQNIEMSEYVITSS